ncbi:ABC transporter substrate-binding protein [uncultured Desulfuromusa sp.]|uniref:ABC transporter substrate-binding protein n=1 Tax=uncultured Desulfuromusa sp. TaxID=219183 RepID=UPI002AA67359|nr:ABC transporter substrate-binding protein [uncultured Desulfuromusa sp.]
MRATPQLTKILLVLLFTGFIFSPPLAAESIRVGTWKTAQTIQPFFYRQFLPEEVQVEISSFTNPADQKTALLAGSLQMTGTTLAHAIYSAVQGQPVVIVAALCNKCSALVVGKNSDIHSEKDLKGKTIGYVPGTMHEILLRETLTRNGISPETDVKLVRIDFFDMGTALGRGNIDAFLSGEPFPTLAVKKGYGRILSYPYYDDSVGTINAGMLVTQSMIDKNPELVSQLVQAHAKATVYLSNHQSEWLKAAANFGTPLNILQSAAPNMELGWDMNEAFIRQVKTLGQRMQALGIIPVQPDYDKLLNLSFVRQVRSKMP